MATIENPNKISGEGKPDPTRLPELVTHFLRFPEIPEDLNTFVNPIQDSDFIPLFLMGNEWFIPGDVEVAGLSVVAVNKRRNEGGKFVVRPAVHLSYLEGGPVMRFQFVDDGTEKVEKLHVVREEFEQHGENWDITSYVRILDIQEGKYFEWPITKPAEERDLVRVTQAMECATRWRFLQDRGGDRIDKLSGRLYFEHTPSPTHLN